MEPVFQRDFAYRYLSSFAILSTIKIENIISYYSKATSSISGVVG
jgi:hypothetical protein